MRRKWVRHGIAIGLTAVLVLTLGSCFIWKDEPPSEETAPSASVSPADDSGGPGESGEASSGSSGAPSEQSEVSSSASSSSPSVSSSSAPDSSDESGDPNVPTAPEPSAPSSGPQEDSSSTVQKTPTYHVRTPSAPGDKVIGNDVVSIDVSNLSQGYMMVQYTGGNAKPILRVTTSGGTVYDYLLSRDGSYDTISFSAGNGSYSVNVFENVSGTSYALAYGDTVSVSLDNALLPFLYPNQYVDFSSGSVTVSKGAELASTAADELGVVENVYNWVIGNISYDFDKAADAESGSIAWYLPDVDRILQSGAGICFDYAAVMVTMLRTQDIPAKLVIGYAGGIYHAWINVYITNVGWVDGMIYFDGTSWVRMDPTFASSANNSQEILDYIGNSGNYSAMYVY